jgi:hypothetical protein
MAFILEIKVVPSSGKQRIVRDKNGQIKCFLIAAPEKGKANKELIELLSKMLKIPKKELDILSGETTRIKRIAIQGSWTAQELYKKLGVEEGEQRAVF